MAKKLARKKTTAKPAAKAKSRRRKANAAGRRRKPRRRQAKYVYFFGRKTDGNGSMKPLLGGKGANLAEMCRIGLPVPPGSRSPPRSAPTTTPTSGRIRRRCAGQMEAGIAALEKQTGKKFGDLKNPLLVSVRSGARDSMPGMMDTILNLGLNDQTVEALAAKTENERFAWDCYRRFVQMYGDVVLGVQKRHGRRSRAVRDGDPRAQARALSPGHRGHEAHRRRPEGTGRRASRRSSRSAPARSFPRSPWEQLLRRGRRRVRLVDERPRDRLSPQVQHPDRMGHRRQRAGDGLRQHRRRRPAPASRSRATRRTARRSSTANS